MSVRTSSVVATGMVALLAIGLVTIFGGTIAAVVAPPSAPETTVAGPPAPPGAASPKPPGPAPAGPPTQPTPQSNGDKGR